MLKLIQDTYPCNNEIPALINAIGAERYITNLNKLIPRTEIKIQILQYSSSYPILMKYICI